MPELQGTRLLFRRWDASPSFASPKAVFLLIPGIDLLIDERAGRKMFQKLPLEDKTLLEHPDMLHALSIDLGREKVFKDILDWAAPRS